ncbi:MAG TPA: glycerophosphodiester phosphodiesterase [Solirubrobacteraceae bacterium]|jgi:glycerophosphoryl diester phosphodiesterase|nr:glycerophosphodiester phosphodiesterase [Solirubrobacteraceae bacterium]
MSERILRRVGHKGADLIAPGNTHASFDAALAAGVDMIEFDVLVEPPADWRSIPVRRAERRTWPQERLILAHDWKDASSRAPHTLEEGLAHLASERFSEVELDIDLKLPGYELRVLDALRRHDLVGRALVSSQYRHSLAVIRHAEPSVRLGWSVPKLRRDPFQYPALLPATMIGLYSLRAALPTLAGRAIRSGRCDALMAHWRLVSPALVASVRAAGGELYVWTVDELPRIRALQELGVDGVITNDPRLFTAPA